ncbi:PorT family protein [Chryseobacterium sp. WG23]|uniref:PorT family protein n=1 Tax=Chryseobacterium sp. WG23 TaxID=2926910 RepID=UPI00211DFF10|nr:PorT family protein [Chryseobacterium sp. WG23]MCQ9635140.1 PorT family protein [Chryseobacterium sp. WG23]
MNNEWLNNLRSRMDDHEEDVPEGLWDDIRDELFSEEDKDKMIAGFIPEEQHEIGKNNGRKVIDRRLFYRIGGAAAAAVLLFFVLQIDSHIESPERISKNADGFKEKGKKNIETGNAKGDEGYIVENKVDKEVSLAETTIERTLKGIHDIQFFNKEVKSNTEVAQDAVRVPETKMWAQQETEISQKPLLIEKTVVGPMKEKETDEVLFKPEKKQEKYAENKKHKSDQSWMLSMLTGNASSNAAEQQFPGYASMSGKPMNIEQVWTASTYDDNPLTEVLLANQSQPVEAKIRHKVPVTLGLSLYYNLGKRWGIGTGLNYTKLSSELHSGSSTNYIKGVQTVHYIGVPVQVNYNVVQKGRFTGYVTAGALVEKPVGGNLTTSYVVDDEIKETTKESIDNKSLQFSVNTAVGLQLKVIDRFGIYAEPGIGYHFKENNALNTVYKEKPLQFNVKFGIRLLLD